MVTNGPWLTLEIDGAGPGAVLDRRRGPCGSPRWAAGVERLVLYGPDGEIAASAGAGLEHEVTVDGGLWLAAAAYGGTDPHTVENSP